MCFADYRKAFDCFNYTKLWHVLKKIGISKISIQNLYTHKKATICIVHDKEVRQDCILSFYLFNLCTEYILREIGNGKHIVLAMFEHSFKTKGRGINNLYNADETADSQKSK